MGQMQRTKFHCWLYCIIMYVKKKKKIKTDICFYKTDYGKMLKYREKYRSTDLSVDLYLIGSMSLSPLHL